MDLMETLRRLTAAYGPSGKEDEVAQVIQELAAPYCDELRRDTLGNLICHRRGRGQRQILRPDPGHRGKRPLLRRPCQRGRGHLAERGRGGHRLALRG